MARIVRMQAEDGADDYLPPTYYLHFSKEEFPDFLANPTGVMSDLGHPVKNLTVTVKDHVWDARPDRQEWITEDTGRALFADAGAPDGGTPLDLPTASSWQWLCGYSDEMCVCEKVIMF